MVVRVSEVEVISQLKEMRKRSKYEAERLRAHIIISATSLRQKTKYPEWLDAVERRCTRQ